MRQWLIKLVPVFLMFFMALQGVALAQEEAPSGDLPGYPLEIQDAAGLGESIVKLIKDVGMPIGGAFLLLGVVVIAVRFVLISIGSGRREEAMQNLLYVAIGGIILGAALFISGALLGIGQTFGG